MKINFAYYNQYKNGIEITFADNTLLFLSCAIVDIPFEKCTLFGISVHPYPA